MYQLVRALELYCNLCILNVSGSVQLLVIRAGSVTGIPTQDRTTGPDCPSCRFQFWLPRKCARIQCAVKILTVYSQSDRYMLRVCDSCKLPLNFAQNVIVHADTLTAAYATTAGSAARRLHCHERTVPWKDDIGLRLQFEDSSFGYVRSLYCQRALRCGREVNHCRRALHERVRRTKIQEVPLTKPCRKGHFGLQ